MQNAKISYFYKKKLKPFLQPSEQLCFIQHKAYHCSYQVQNQIINIKNSVGCGIDKEQSRDLSNFAKQRKDKTWKHCFSKFEAKQKSQKNAKRNRQKKIEYNDRQRNGRTQQIGFEKAFERN